MLSRIRKSMADKDQGFTLIELLVVIIIIGILAAIAIPVFLNQRKKGIDAGTVSEVKNAGTAAMTLAAKNPDSNVLYNAPDLVLAGWVQTAGNTVTMKGTPLGQDFCISEWNSSGNSTALLQYTYQEKAGGFQKTQGVCP